MGTEPEVGEKAAGIAEKDIQLFMKGLVLFAVVCFGGAIGFYLLYFHDQTVGGPESWALFGDYMGGVLGPLVAFAALFGLLGTIRIQREELRLTKVELQRSAGAQEQSLGVIYAASLVPLLAESHKGLIDLMQTETKLALICNTNIADTDIKEFRGSTARLLFRDMRILLPRGFKPDLDLPETSQFFQSMAKLLYSMFNMCRTIQQNTGQNVVGFHYWLIISPLIREVIEAEALLLPPWIESAAEDVMAQWANNPTDLSGLPDHTKPPAEAQEP